MKTRTFAALLAIGILAVTNIHAAPMRAIVVDDHTFRAVDVVTGKTSDVVPLRAGRQRLLYSNDLTRLAIFSIPQDGAQPAAATVFDAAALTRIASVDLGWGINDILPVGGDSVYVLTRGARSGDAAKRRPAALANFDIRTGEVRQRIAFERDAEELDLAPDGINAIVYMSGDARHSTPAEVRFVERATFEQKAAVKLTPGASAPIALKGSQQFYSIDPGDNKTGKLYIFTSNPPALNASVDVGGGAEIAAVQPETNRQFVFGHNADAEGYIDVVHNGAVEKRITVPFEPMLIDFAPDGSRATVTGRSFRGVMGIHAGREQIVDLSDLAATSEQPVKVPTRAEMAMNRVAGALERCCGTLDHSVDVANRIETAARILEGPKTAAVLGAGTVAGAIAVAINSDERVPAHISEPRLYTEEFDPGKAKKVDLSDYFVFRDDENGNVSFSLDRDDHLIVRRESDGRRLAKINVDDGRKEMVALERTLAIVGDDRLTLVHLETRHQVGDTIKVGGDVLGVAVSPDERYGAVIGENRVTFIDGPKIALGATVRDLSGTIRVIFVP